MSLKTVCKIFGKEKPASIDMGLARNMMIDMVCRNERYALMSSIGLTNREKAFKIDDLIYTVEVRLSFLGTMYSDGSKIGVEINRYNLMSIITTEKDDGEVDIHHHSTITHPITTSEDIFDKRADAWHKSLFRLKEYYYQRLVAGTGMQKVKEPKKPRLIRGAA